jgi:hypothetical protein
MVKMDYLLGSATRRADATHEWPANGRESLPSNSEAYEQVTLGSITGILERREFGVTVLSPAAGRAFRRVVYLNSYGGVDILEKVKNGTMASHHLWGCLELARMGYEIALPAALPHFNPYRRQVPHDLRFLGLVRQWLRPDDIIYCGHTLLFWLPLLSAAGIVRRRIVSLMFAREQLDFAKAHSGIVALTRAGAEQAASLAPAVNVAPIGWGADLSVYPHHPYRPEAFFSCGIAMRDFRTLSAAAAMCRHPVEVVVPGQIDGVQWAPSVTTIDSGKGWNYQNKRLSYRELLNNHYSRSAGSLIIVKKDPSERIACGFTEIIEAMAMSRPVIMTKTGALPSEIDIEKVGCGIFVPAEDPDAIAEAVNYLGEHPEDAESMGRKGRALVESYYNIGRYAADLHRFFERLS